MGRLMRPPKDPDPALWDIAKRPSLGASQDHQRRLPHGPCFTRTLPALSFRSKKLRGSPRRSMCRGCSAPSAAYQVNVRPKCGDRVTSRVDAIHSGKWVKDHLPALRSQFVHALLDGKDAEFCFGSSLRPDGG